MSSNSSDKTFRKIIAAAFAVVLISLAVCAVVFFLPEKENTGVNVSDVTSQANGEFVGFISPAEDRLYRGEETLTLSVSAKNGAEAYAMVAGQRIPLTVSSQSLDGYSVFSGNIVLPAAQSYTQNIGYASFFVTYNGITQICYGGTISVSSDANIAQSTSPSVNVTDSTSETMNTGTATALVVTGAITEGKDVTRSELFYNPTYGNLVQGMTDYVTEKIIDYDDDGNEVDFYRLLSGRAVRADSNVTLVGASNTMTYNTAELSSADDAAGKKIVIKETVKVPYKLSYVGQAFTKGYEKLAYNAKPFTATAIDFIFDYTVSFTGSLSSFSDEIVSSVQATLNTDNKTMILHCVLRRPGKFYGYIMEYGSSGNLCLSFRKPVRSISGLSVIIDPGHGGNPGALDYTRKYRESDQTLSISRHLASYLSSAGASVYMTRTADNEVSLETRRLMNQQIKPDLFISIHLNGAENTKRNGTSTYYFTPFSQPLASCITNRIAAVFANCYRDNPDMLKNINGGDRYYPFFVTRTDVCPSVLIEVGFFTNELESKYLIDGAYHQAFAKAIFEAVGDFVNSQ